jgi:hypothetical protein
MLFPELRRIKTRNVRRVAGGIYRRPVRAEIDIYPMTSRNNDALVYRESLVSFECLLDQGWTDALREKHPGKRICIDREARGTDAASNHTPAPLSFRRDLIFCDVELCNAA